MFWSKNNKKFKIIWSIISTYLKAPNKALFSWKIDVFLISPWKHMLWVLIRSVCGQPRSHGFSSKTDKYCSDVQADLRLYKRHANNTALDKALFATEKYCYFSLSSNKRASNEYPQLCFQGEITKLSGHPLLSGDMHNAHYLMLQSTLLANSQRPDQPDQLESLLWAFSLCYTHGYFYDTIPVRIRYAMQQK